MAHLKKSDPVAGDDLSSLDDVTDPTPAAIPSRNDDTAGWTRETLKIYQDKDPGIAAVKEWLRTYGDSGPPKKLIEPETKEVKRMVSIWNQLVLSEGILYKRASEGHTTLRYVVPHAFRRQIMVYLHRSPLAGHMGIYRTTCAAIRRFYWPSNEG